MISYSPSKMAYKYGQEAGAILQLETQVGLSPGIPSCSPYGPCHEDSLAFLTPWQPAPTASILRYRKSPEV